MSEKKYELSDDLLEQVSGGTGVEEEDIPTYSIHQSSMKKIVDCRCLKN